MPFVWLLVNVFVDLVLRKNQVNLCFESQELARLTICCF